MTTLFAVVGKTKAEAVGVPLSAAADVVAFGEVEEVDAELIIAVKWHPTDQTTYDVSATAWNRWVFVDLMAANPNAKVMVL